MKLISGFMLLVQITHSTEGDLLGSLSEDERDGILLIHTGLDFEEYLEELNRTRTARPESDDSIKAKELGFVF